MSNHHRKHHLISSSKCRLPPSLSADQRVWDFSQITGARGGDRNAGACVSLRFLVPVNSGIMNPADTAHSYSTRQFLRRAGYYKAVLLSISALASRKESARVYDCRTRATISGSFAFPEADNADSFSKQDFPPSLPPSLSFSLPPVSISFFITIRNREQPEVPTSTGF